MLQNINFSTGVMCTTSLKKHTKVYPPHIFLLLSKWSNYVDCRMWNVDFLFVARSTGTLRFSQCVCQHDTLIESMRIIILR